MPSRGEFPAIRVPGLWACFSVARNSYQFQRVPANRMCRQISDDPGQVPDDDPRSSESLVEGAKEFAPAVGACRLAGAYDRVTRCGRRSVDPCVLPNPLVEIVRLSAVSRLWSWRRLAGMQRRICDPVLLLDCAVPAMRRTYGDEFSRCIPQDASLLSIRSTSETAHVGSSFSRGADG